MGMGFLSWSPRSCRKAALGNRRSRELIVPFGATGDVVFVEVAGLRCVISEKTTTAPEPI